MSEPPDLADLARRYVDLWQEYLADLARDEAAAQAFATLFEQAGAAFAAGAAAAKEGQADHGEQERAGERRDRTSPDGGAPAAALAPGGGDGGLDELARRVAELEKRLDSVAPGSGAGGPGAGRRARRRAR